MCVTKENDTGGLSVLLLATAVAKRVCNRLLLMLQVMQSEGNAIIRALLPDLTTPRACVGQLASAHPAGLVTLSWPNAPKGQEAAKSPCPLNQGWCTFVVWRFRSIKRLF